MGRVKWVTRERPKTDRIACPWLIRRFIDADAEILYVSAEQVLAVAELEAAHSFDKDLDATSQSAGLKAVAEGFSYLEPDDQRQLELELPVYDALYAWCRGEIEAGRA